MFSIRNADSTSAVIRTCPAATETAKSVRFYAHKSAELLLVARDLAEILVILQ
jgi:hypothetical protein